MSVELAATPPLPTLLRLLVRNAPDGAVLAFCSIRAKKLKYKFFPATLKGAQALFNLALQDDKAGRDCYVQCTLLKHTPPIVNGKQGRGKKEDVLGGNSLFTDIDRPEKPNGGLTPTVLVSSGNGWHMHFGLTEFLPDVAKIEEINKLIAAKYQADDCWDASRLLRVPGTRNHKDPKNPKLVVETVNKQSLTTPERLLKALDSYVKAETLDLSGGVPKEWPIPEPEPVGDEDLAKLDSRLLKNLTTASKKKDRSGHDFNMAMLLLTAGWTVGQLHTAMLNEDWSISSKALAKGEDYIRRTLYKATTKLEASGKARTDRSKPLLAELLQNKRRGPDGKLIVGQPSYEWCQPLVRRLIEYGTTFRRNSDDPAIGYVGTERGMLETKDEPFDDWIQEKLGEPAEHRLHREFKSWLQAEVRGPTSKPIKVRPWVVLEKAKGERKVPTVVMIADATANEIREVALQHPITQEVYSNGEKDLLLTKSNRLARALPNEKTDMPLSRLREVFTDQLACSEVSREILTAYLLAAPLVRGFGIVTLPLLYLTGTPGSGKTQTLKLISTYFHGTYKVLGDSTPAAMYRGAAVEIFVPFDDYDKLSDQIKGFILSTTTGAERQKSEGKNAIVTQDLHVLLAFTSTKELPDEALRRRALRIEINKARWHGMGHFSEEHWKRINEIRDSMWWAWMRVMSKSKLSHVMENFDSYTQETEKLITVDANRPLAGFLTLLYQCLKMAESSLDMRVGSIENWIKELKLGDQEEVFDRHELMPALDLLFDTVLEDEGFQSNLDQMVHKGLLAHMMGPNFPLRYEMNNDQWLTLKGTSGQWAHTLQRLTRFSYKANAITTGNDFKALIGESPDHSQDAKVSRTYSVGRYRVQHITNAGATGSGRGWKVAIFVPKETK